MSLRGIFTLLLIQSFLLSFAHTKVSKAKLCAHPVDNNAYCSWNQSSNDTIYPPDPPIINIKFSGKIFLQGAVDMLSGKMSTALNVLGVLEKFALSQPYNSIEIGYSGNEKVNPGFFVLNPDIVDWVLVEVSPAEPPYFKLRRAAFVKADGSLLDLDGSPYVLFREIGAGSYFITIRHRNHLGIRSRLPLDFTSGIASYDFTTSAEQAFQNQTYTSTIQVSNSWAMRGGNANSNANIKFNGPFNDQEQIQNLLGGSFGTVLEAVYSAADVNMDGKVRTAGPVNDQNFLLNNILIGMLGMVYVEQL